MESQSRIFKVVVQFQEKDEVFYTRIKSFNGVPASLMDIICQRYPSLTSLVKRCFVKDQTGAEFSIINNDDLSVFLDGEDLFENVVQVEINGVERGGVVVGQATPAKKVRIAAQEGSPTKNSADEEGKAVHKNVVCDCCDATIVGYRYKCTECFNYDLCMTCEGKMRHRDHIMIRIPEPSKAYSPCRFMKLNRGAPTETAQPGEEKSRRHHHKRHHHNRRGHFGRPQTMFEGFFRPFDAEGTASDPDTDGAPGQQEPRPCHAEPTTGGAPQPPPYDFQKLVKAVEHVAGNVAKFLEPLGMSLDTYTDYEMPSANGPTCSTANPTKTATENNTAAKEKEQSPEPMVVDETAEKAVSANKEPVPSTSAALVPEPFIVDVVDEGPTSQSIIEPTTSADRSSPASHNSADDAEWLVISNEGFPDSPHKEAAASTPEAATEVANPVVASTSVQTQIGYDELARKLQKDIEEQLKINSSTTATQTNAVPVVHHPIPHINMSIQRMVDMGFSNDGESLTNLMVCCNGDIRKALDMLLHKK